jgi:hypothetical protein
MNTYKSRGMTSLTCTPLVLSVSVKFLSTTLACHEERCIFNHNWHLLVDFDCTRCCPRGYYPVHVTDMNDLLSIIFLYFLLLSQRASAMRISLTFYFQLWIVLSESRHLIPLPIPPEITWSQSQASLLDTPNILIYNL